MSRVARRLPFACLLVACWLLPAPLIAQVSGRITHAGTGEGVAGALVQLRGVGVRSTSSDRDGHYAFDGVVAGEYCVHVLHPGYEPAHACIGIGSAAALVLDLPLTVRPVALAPVLVTGERGRATHVAWPTAALDSSGWARRAPARTLDAAAGRTFTAAVLGELTKPRAREPDFGAQHNALHLWGSASERGRVLLDGASINVPLHLGALLPPLDPHVLSSSALRTGGISPRYDGGAAYILEYTTRPAAPRGGSWGELDVLTGQAGFELAVADGGQLLASARRVNHEAIDGLLSPDFGYGYTDVLARADLRLSQASGLHVTAFGTDESVALPRDLGSDRASWANRAALLEWRSEQGRARRSALLSLSSGLADLPLLSAPGGHLRADLERASATLRQQGRAGASSWDAGLELEHMRFARRASATADPVSGVSGDVSCTDLLPCTRASATIASAFGELGLAPRPWLAATAGVRVSWQAQAERVHVLPRATLTLLPAQDFSFTLSAGRFSQAMLPDAGIDVGPADWLALELSHATHLEIAARHERGGAWAQASAFVRRFDAAAGVKQRRLPGIEANAGYVTSLGTLSLGYRVSGYLSDDSVAAQRSMQQQLALGFDGRYRALRLELAAAWGHGVPITAIVLDNPRPRLTGGEVPAESYDAVTGSASREYVRLDATLGAELQLRAGERALHFMPYLRIVNALNQQDALFYFQQATSAPAAQPIARLPAVPTLGLRWRF